MSAVFKALDVGDLHLPNRIFMAPMTRGRAPADGTPTKQMAQYYAARADAGLLVTEGICVSPRARGWNGAPWIYGPKHEEGWRTVTDGVHARGGRLFAQLWFLGRVSHPVFLGGDTPWGPSALRPDHHVHGPTGETHDCVVPHAMTQADIVGAIDDFVAAAQLAMKAGFDGVQIHAANGYLPDQFLRDSANIRSDRYGGSIANRLRFLLELVEACCAAIGASKVSVRLSPLNRYNDIHDSEPAKLFGAAATELSEFDLAFLEIVEGLPGHFLHVEGEEILPIIRARYDGVLVANGGYDLDAANEVIEKGGADAVSFGVPFISNPDLVDRFRHGWPLSPPDPATFYSAGEPGYLDYPPYDPESGGAESYRGLSLAQASRH